jgi:hypothetical protein
MFLSFQQKKGCELLQPKKWKQTQKKQRHPCRRVHIQNRTTLPMKKTTQA